MAAPRDRRQKPRYHCLIGQPTAPERGTMRTLLLAAACVVLFATAMVSRPDDGLAINCAAVRSACVSTCNNRETSQAGFQACSNRCSIQSCRDTVIECRAGDQTVCNNGFRSCNNGCDALASIPTAAAIQNQTACQSRCCTQFKVCLVQRGCDVGTITCQ
jgi:hypothetical protein